MATSAETFTPPRPAPEAEEVYRRWLQFLDDEFVRHSAQPVDMAVEHSDWEF